MESPSENRSTERFSPVSAAHPLVSICSLTFNHAPFIACAWDGFLMQETRFPVEIIIHDDCSTDGTREIIAEYQRRFPGRITAILQSENQHSKGRHVFPLVLERARGRYIAVCEGDDFWTSPAKLQTQVDWLEQHPESPLCFHNVEVWDEKTSSRRGMLCPSTQAPFLTLDEILKGNPIGTCSVMFRREQLPAWPAEMQALYCGDWPRWILMMRHGPAGYINQTWSCYRHHGGGIWSPLPGSKQMRKALSVFPAVLQQLGPSFRKAVRAGEKSILAMLVNELIAEGRWREAAGPALRYVLSSPGRFRPPPGQFTLYLRLLLRKPSEAMHGLKPRNNP